MSDKTSKSAETVKVRIVARHTVHYRQFVTMTRDEWDEMKEMPEDELVDNGGGITGWLDLSDIDDADDSLEYVQAVVVDPKTDEPVQPTDEIEGHG